MLGTLLHDTVEGTPMLLENIETLFNKEVAQICRWGDAPREQQGYLLQGAMVQPRKHPATPGGSRPARVVREARRQAAQHADDSGKTLQKPAKDC